MRAIRPTCEQQRSRPLLKDSFVSLIRFTRESVSDDLRREAIHRVVDSIRHQQKSEAEAGVETEQFNLICDDKEIHFRSELSHFIFNILGVVTQIDPQLARELIRENPDIQTILKGQDTSAPPGSYCQGE